MSVSIITSYKMVEMRKIMETLKMGESKKGAFGVGIGSTWLILAVRNQAGKLSWKLDWTVCPDPFSEEKERKLAVCLK